MNLTEYTDRHRRVLEAEGILVVLLGLLAIVLPRFVTLGIGIILGAILLAAGILKLNRTFHFRGLPGFTWSLAGALLLMAGGLFFLFYPLEGMAAITIVLVALFLLDGIGEIAIALSHRETAVWIFILTSGIISLALAVLLLAHWPSSAAWAVGLLLGINLLFSGTWLLALSSALRQRQGTR